MPDVRNVSASLTGRDEPCPYEYHHTSHLSAAGLTIGAVALQPKVF